MLNVQVVNQKSMQTRAHNDVDLLFTNDLKSSFWLLDDNFELCNAVEIVCQWLLFLENLILSCPDSEMENGGKTTTSVASQEIDRIKNI